ncbi:hypothetical protein CC86DRAFT_134764 [Ophiobolus disseminans]|uniref:Uncharacterized protein n=1 Tax=Ophiobolus disseminans TaxID=1469910 RepID=A0A6A7ACV6_9PLEO|nr:hypothetical protein CC86DRAFT_134764 [Ophiobolus disseminans]
MTTSLSSNTSATTLYPPQDPGQLSERKVGLDGIPNDIHYLIASELMECSPSAVQALGQSSKTLRQATLPLVFRHLVLKRSTKGSQTYEAYQALVEAFREHGNNEIAHHVRSLVVKNDLPEEDLMLVLDKISECGTLSKLSWETTAHISPSVLDKLHATWPDLELSVCVLNRAKAPIVLHRQMDTKLLSSPLLKKLTYNVYHEGASPEKPARSEWPKLTHALVSGGNVRALKIDSQPDRNRHRGDHVLKYTEPIRMMRLDITPGIRLPALEEFAFRGEGSWGPPPYLWDAEHCQLLREAMDMSRLRKLDFGSVMPVAFFSTFTGLLPELKALRFGIVPDGSINVTTRFIKSLKSLESLDIGRAQSAIDLLWPAIMKHKGSLKELILRPTTAGYCQPQYIDLERLQTLSIQFPMLERLGWDAPCKVEGNIIKLYRKTLGRPEHHVDPKHFAIVRSMNLKKLDLFLHLPDHATVYSEQLEQDAMGSIEAPPLDIDGSRAAAIGIMETISKAQERPLEKLTLHFARTGRSDRCQPYMMDTMMHLRRSKEEGAVGDSKYEVRGNQSWWGVSELQQEIMFED